MVYVNLSEHPSEVMKKVGHQGQVILSMVNNNDMDSLLQTAKNPDGIIDEYLKLKNVSDLGFGEIHMLLAGADTPEKVYKALGTRAKTFFSTLDSSSMMGLLRFAKEPDKITQMIGSARMEKMVKELTPEETITFHASARGVKRDKLAQMIIRIKGAELTDEEVSEFATKALQADSVIIPIIEAKGSNLSDSNVHVLMHSTGSPDLIANKIIDIMGDRLGEQGIRAILKRAPSTEAFTAKIIELFGERLDSKMINIILSSAINTDGAAKSIIRAKGDSLGGKDAFVLLHFSNNPTVTAKLFSQTTLTGLVAMASAMGASAVDGMGDIAGNPASFHRVMNQIINFQTVESIRGRLRSELLL